MSAAGFDAVGQVVGEAEADGDFIGILFRQVGEQVVVVRLAGAEDHPLGG